MLLGIARTADMAGWGTSPYPAARTTVNTTAANNNPFLVTPRNYILNPGVYSSTGKLIEMIAPTGTAPVDSTGIGLAGQQATWAYTMQFGTDYMTTAPSDGQSRGAVYYDRFTAAGTSYFARPFGVQVQNGVYYFTTSQTESSGGPSVVFNNFNTLRNTWLGIVVSVSNTSASFANWTGGTGTGYQRLVITNVATGVVLQQTDSAFSGTLFDRSLSNQYYYNTNNSASYRYEPFWYSGTGTPTDWSSYYISDWNLASTWINWGSALDPAVYYSSLTGSSVGTTVAGQRAWYAYNINTGTTTSTGYTANLPAGSRMPAGSTIISDNLGSGAAAQLVAF